jgi:hypothetical protein
MHVVLEQYWVMTMLGILVVALLMTESSSNFGEFSAERVFAMKVCDFAPTISARHGPCTVLKRTWEREQQLPIDPIASDTVDIYPRQTRMTLQKARQMNSHALICDPYTLDFQAHQDPLHLFLSGRHYVFDDPPIVYSSCPITKGPDQERSDLFHRYQWR